MTHTQGEPAATETTHHTHFDAVIVGAGMGGIYALQHFRKLGFSVHGFEAASDVGGVWYHNRYPGARVDVEANYYSYVFDPELYSSWEWKERYPAQPEILEYLKAAADKHDVRREIEFNTRVIGAQWDPEANQYAITTDTGGSYTARYLVMTSGQLSKPKKPTFEGLDSFKGEWVQTSAWPDRHIETKGKRIAVIGTGSSGVQAIPVLAEVASHLYVFQRTPNYSVPAHNGPLDSKRYGELAENVRAIWPELLRSPTGVPLDFPTKAASELTPEEQQARLEHSWAEGAHNFNLVFTDQGRNKETNDIVVEFVHKKIREAVDDPAVAQLLMPTDYPIGSRRLCVDTDYYKTFNRKNVELVNIKGNEIDHITEQGIVTADGNEYQVDLIVFALGFNAFTGALDNTNIRNEKGEQPSDIWNRGPRTYLGLQTVGFPNLFVITGPGSPSVLANMIVSNVQHINFAGELLTYMRDRGFNRVEPTLEAQDAWTEHVAEVSSKLLRLNVENYMVHVNRDDGSRVFQPYVGGMHTFVAKCDEVIANDFEGFDFQQVGGTQ
ncbi:MAG: cyclohexanone monooxygenase [Nocardioidaceae bacterium]|nr:cyclohexanone monooxygenase [Nocardioidaceae bacterium]